MQYMLLINLEETQMPSAAPGERPMSADYAAYTDAMRKAGILVAGDRLQETRASKKVRVRDGKAVVLDGPFTDTKEQLGGYYLIDVPSLAEAVSWAERCPSAATGSIDVRPIFAFAPR